MLCLTRPVVRLRCNAHMCPASWLKNQHHCSFSVMCSCGWWTVVDCSELTIGWVFRLGVTRSWHNPKPLFSQPSVHQCHITRHNTKSIKSSVRKVSRPSSGDNGRRHDSQDWGMHDCHKEQLQIFNSVEIVGQRENRLPVKEVSEKRRAMDKGGGVKIDPSGVTKERLAPQTSRWHWQADEKKKCLPSIPCASALDKCIIPMRGWTLAGCLMTNPTMHCGQMKTASFLSCKIYMRVVAW